MHLLGAGLAHHPHDLHRGRAAHEAVVDEHDALAGNGGAVGGMLHAHAELAHRLGRLDEGAADIMVADDAELVGKPAGLREAEGRRHAGIRHRNDHVRIDGGFESQLAAHALADIVDAAAVHDGIGAREVDVFEDVGARRLLGREAERLEPIVRDHHAFAVLDIADEAGADDVEGAGLGGEDVAAVELAQHQRADAQRVAGADQLLVGQRHQGIGALDLLDRLDEAVDRPGPCGCGRPGGRSPRYRSWTGRWRRRG